MTWSRSLARLATPSFDGVAPVTFARSGYNNRAAGMGRINLCFFLFAGTVAMAVDLMELVTGSLSHSVGESLGGLMGLPVEQAVGLFESAAGLILGELKIRSALADGAALIHKTARDQDFGLLDRFGSLLADETRRAGLQLSGSRILQDLFGSESGQLTKDFAQTNRLQEPAAAELLNLAAPVVMGVIGRKVSKQSLNAAGLASLLAVQPAWVAPDVTVQETVDAPVRKAALGSGASDHAGDRLSDSTDIRSSRGDSIMKSVIAFCFGGVVVAATVWYLNQPYKPALAPSIGNPAQKEIAPGPAEATASDDAIPNPPVVVPENEGFELEKLLDKFGSVAAGFKNISLDDAAGIAEKLTGLSESIDSMGLDRLKGLSRSLFRIAAAKMRKELVDLQQTQTDERILKVIRPAIRKLEDKLAEHGF